MAQYSSVPFADPPWHRIDVRNPAYKESHKRLQEFMRSYVDQHIRPFAQEWEENGEVPKDAIARHAAMGLLAVTSSASCQRYANGLSLPAEIDYEEWDVYHDLIVTDEIARCGYLGVVWGINCGANVGSPILENYCTDEQKMKWLGPLLRGEQRHCLAVTEPEAGSDVAGLTSTATKSADGQNYVVNGLKKWITQGQWADYALTIARTAGSGGKGLSALMIDLNSPGITRTRMENSGVKASGSTLIEFDDVLVPLENLIGHEGDAFKILMFGFNRERLWISITSNRLCRVALEDSYEYALKRVTFGQPLISRQIIRAKIANMSLRIEAAWALIETVHRMSLTMGSVQLGKWAAMCKTRAGNDLEFCSREAQQIYGGAAFSRGGRAARVEQISRDLRCLVVSGGSEEIMIDLIGKSDLPRSLL